MRVVLLLMALAGCGKFGPPQPAGPPEQVTFPHAYPTPPKQAGTPSATPPGTAPPLAPIGLPTPTTLPGAPMH